MCVLRCDGQLRFRPGDAWLKKSYRDGLHGGASRCKQPSDNCATINCTWVDHGISAISLNAASSRYSVGNFSARSIAWKRGPLCTA